MDERNNRSAPETQRKLQIAKKKSALSFAGYIAGERTFRLKTHKGGIKKCVLRTEDVCVIGGEKFYRLTAEQARRFKDVEAEFQCDYCAAKRGEAGFLYASKDGETRYARRLPDWRYQFIAERPNGDVVQMKTSIADYLKGNRFDREICFPDSNGGLHEWRAAEEHFYRREADLLQRTADDYLTYEVKYLSDLATKDEVDFLVCSDGKLRFFKSKEIYDIGDITVRDFKRIPPSLFSRSKKYWLTVEAEGGVYRAFDFCGKSIDIKSEGKSTRCPITDALRGQINLLIASGNRERQNAEARRDLIFIAKGKCVGKLTEKGAGEAPQVCCFAGPRPKNYPWGDDKEREREVFARLKEEIGAAYALGYRHFITGMAAGVDMVAAKIVLELCRKNPEANIVLEAAVPFPSQPQRWTEETKREYYAVLAQCGEVYVAAQEFSPAAYRERDRYMIDRSSLVIAVEGQGDGGTARTIGYAEKSGKTIIRVR